MIVRAPRRQRWTTLSNTPIEDARLSWKARGLLVYLLSKPDGWSVTIKGLINQAPDGKDSVTAGLTELEEAGYLVRQRHRQPEGTFAWTSTLHEEPQVTARAGYPDTVHPDTVHPHTENPDDYLGTEDLGTEEQERAPSSAPPPPPQSDDLAFERFWRAYPLKKAKGGARAKWRTALKKADAETLIAAAEQYRDNPRRDPNYTAHATTWLHQERWLDEPDTPAALTYRCGPESVVYR